MIEAVLFDMDGVITDTGEVHAAASKPVFDEHLAGLATARHEDFRPFDADRDYREFVDGRPRYEGVSPFLHSRGIRVPYGTEVGGKNLRTTTCAACPEDDHVFGARTTVISVGMVD